MLSEDGTHLYVTYEEYHSLIERLALQIADSGWQFDLILCLARGGLRPGDVLSRIFDKPLAILSTSSYRAEAGTQQGELSIAENITCAQSSLHGRVLLVDDLADTGHTLASIAVHFKSHYPEITDLRTAVIWTKGISTFKPNYQVEHLPTSPWIHQPFEEYDAMTIEMLRTKAK